MATNIEQEHNIEIRSHYEYKLKTAILLFLRSINRENSFAIIIDAMDYEAFGNIVVCIQNQGNELIGLLHVIHRMDQKIISINDLEKIWFKNALDNITKVQNKFKERPQNEFMTTLEENQENQVFVIFTNCKIEENDCNFLKNVSKESKLAYNELLSSGISTNQNGNTFQFNFDDTDNLISNNLFLFTDQLDIIDLEKEIQTQIEKCVQNSNQKVDSKKAAEEYLGFVDEWLDDHSNYETPQGVFNKLQAILRKHEPQDKSIIFYSSYNPQESLLIIEKMKNCIAERKLVDQIEHNLNHAILNNDDNKATLLISSITNINAEDSYGFAPLHLAAIFNNNKITQILLTHGAEVNIKDRTGKTPLHWACAMGQNNIVSLLISHQANVNITDSKNMSALHLSIIFQTSDQSILTELLENGASLSQLDDHLKTPFHYAFENPQKDSLEALLKHINIMGELLSARNPEGGTILHWAAQRGFTEILILFLTHGVDPEAKNIEGNTALHLAIETGHIKVTMALLTFEANIESKNNTGKTALMLAVEYSNYTLIELLLSKGANLKVKDNQDFTPLHLGVCGGDITSAGLLLDAGAAIEARDDCKFTALHWAAFNGHIKLLELLLSKGADMEATAVANTTPLHLAAVNGHNLTIDLLLNNGADIEAKDIENRTPLHLAACLGHVDSAKLLLSKGSYLEANTKIRTTPLMFAAIDGHLETLKLLLSQGANLNAINNEGRTVLHMASYKGHLETVRFLLSNGSDIEVKDSEGKSPIVLAAHGGHAKIVELLVNFGANIEIRDNEGMNALEYAESKGHKDVSGLLRSEMSKREEAKIVNGARRSVIYNVVVFVVMVGAIRIVPSIVRLM